MSIHLYVCGPASGFPSEIKQLGIVVLWQAGFDHDEIGHVTSLHPSRVAKVLDLVREKTGALRPVQPEAMR